MTQRGEGEPAPNDQSAERAQRQRTTNTHSHRTRPKGQLVESHRPAPRGPEWGGGEDETRRREAPQGQLVENHRHAGQAMRKGKNTKAKQTNNEK